MRLNLNRLVALAAFVAAGLMAGCSADSPGPTGTPPPGPGTNGLLITLSATPQNPVQGTCSLVVATATLNGAPVPSGTSITLSSTFGTFSQNGLQTISLVTQNGSVQTAVCSNLVGPATITGSVTVGANTNRQSTQITFQSNGIKTTFISVCANPHTGPVSGGTPITITGGGLGTDGTTVPVIFRSGSIVHQAIGTIGGGGTTITATTPAFPELAGLPATPVEIDVLIAGQTLSSPACFTFTSDSNPIISAILPSSGTKVGGTRVTITGSGFSAPVQVFFGGTLEAQVVSVSPTQIIAITPPANGEGPQQTFPQTVGVTVKEVNCGGSTCTSASVPFTYTVGLSIFGFTPDHGDAGTTVTITGQGFVAPLIVTFGGVQGTVLSVSGTQILAQPAAGCGGSGPIVVTLLATGESTSSSTNFIQSGPTVTSGPSPSSGPSNVTTSVTFTGTNLFSAGNPSRLAVTGVSGGAVSIASASQIGTTQTVILNVTPNCSSSVVTFSLQNTITGCTAGPFTFTVTGGTSVSGQTPATPLPVGVATAATVTGTGLFPTGNFAGASISGVVGGTVTVTGGTDNAGVQTLNLSITPSGNSCSGGGFVSFSIQNSSTHCSSGQVSFAVAGTGITASVPSPSSGPAGSTTAVVVTGTGFFPTGNSTAVQVVNVSGGTVIITGASQDPITGQQTVNLNITPTMNGCNPVSVTFALRNSVGGCTSSTLTFTGTGGAPIFTNISPSSGAAGSVTAAVINGSNLFQPGDPSTATIINAVGGTVTITGSANPATATTLNVNITPNPGCVNGTVTFNVHNTVTGCNSSTITFNSLASGVVVKSGPTPSSGPATSTTTGVTITGTGFFPSGNPSAATSSNSAVVITSATDSGPGTTQTLTLAITPAGCGTTSVPFTITNSATSCSSGQLSFIVTGTPAVTAGPTPSCAPSAGGDVVVTGNNFFPIGNPAQVSLTGVANGTATITGAVNLGNGQQELRIHVVPSGANPVQFTITNGRTGCSSQALSVLVDNTGGDCPPPTFP